LHPSESSLPGACVSLTANHRRREKFSLLKILPVKIFAGPCSSESLSSPSALAGTNPFADSFAGTLTIESINQGISGLCELPTTHDTPGKRRQLFWSSLRIAAGGNHARYRVARMQLADRVSGLGIGGGGHSAGVYNHYVRAGRALAGTKPRSRSWRSIAAASAWVARQPNCSM